MQDGDPARTWCAALAMGAIVTLSVNLFNPALFTLLPGAAALMLLAATGAFRWRRFVALAWRMKWFFLSLLLFFGWFGSSSGAETGSSFLPAVDGLQEAALRIAALLLLIGWVVWLTTVFDAASQAGGLNRWLAPFAAIGLPVDRFATRLFLALRYFEDCQGEFHRLVGEVGSNRRSGIRAAREYLVNRLSSVLSANLPESERLAGSGPDSVGAPGSIRALGLQVTVLWVAVGSSWLSAALAGGWWGL